MKSFLDILREKVVVFDGAMGTHLQSQNLSADDFGGERFNGCNEHLVLTKPSAVEQVHLDYLNAGCDVIETNSFGSTSIVLAEYGLEEKAHTLNVEAARLARRLADEFSTAGHPRFVAGSMGPTTKLPSLGHITFREMASAYSQQAHGLLEGGVHLLIVETCQDILQAKAALYGIQRCFEDLRRKVPIVVSVTIETAGTMLLGTEVSAALTAIEPFNVDVFGLNCATGPKEMSDHVRALSATSPLPISVMPNAGIPENVGGRAHYHLLPDEMVRFLAHYVRDLGVNIVGGCCGTTKEHIRALVEAVGGLSPRPRPHHFVPAASSLYQAVPFHIDPSPVLVGERTNANGSRLFRDLLGKNDWEGIVAMGRQQVREQAHMLDVCVAYVGRNEVEDMREVISRFNTQISIPLIVDSTEPQAIEEALRHIGGKPVVNSINLEDGEERLATIVRLCRNYGAAVIALTIDEKGMAKTAREKLSVARRIYKLAVTNGGMRPHDLIFDTLTFTLGSGDEEFRRAAIETIEGIRLIKREFPGVHTVLGVSNISFGLSPPARHALNSVFLHYAVEAGLDMAIVHASRIVPLYRIERRGLELCRQLIFDERRFEGEGEERKVTFDPLVELMEYYSDSKGAAKKATEGVAQSVEERLKRRIIDGHRAGLKGDLDEALQRYAPLEIINTILLDAMRVVGELFGAGQMQLPFVLQSAEVMKAAVSYLEPFMEKKEGMARGTMVIATVKGDVHDIGKNLVDIILSNNGYRVVNLGIKVPVEMMLAAAEEHRADVIGMSGLLVKSTLVMKENLAVMQERNLTIPVILGGAALTRRYVEEDLRPSYSGPVFYANDAFDGLALMEKVVRGEATAGTEAMDSAAEDAEALTGSEAKIAMMIAEEERFPSDRGEQAERRKYQKESDVGTLVARPREAVRQLTEIPSPPFWGSRVVQDIPIDEVFRYVNEVALIRGQWRIVRGKLSEQEYQRVLKEVAYPEFESLKKKVKAEGLLEPNVVYGYFPCQSEGNDLVVYRPPARHTVPLAPHALQEWLRFTFPRQTKAPFLCIADFFSSVESGAVDVVAFHLVTMGRKASEYARMLFESHEYKEYLYFHGLSVESAEALAELWHKRIREELGIAGNDAPEIRRLFSKGYRGARYSFGYPACPNLEDQTKLFELLKPERIGVELTEEYQLVPEQSTSAIIVHHPDARYFNVK